MPGMSATRIRARWAVWPAVLVLVGFSAAAAQAADSSADTALARKWAPVVRLKERPGSCGIGEPYQPLDIDVLLGNPEVALRGPWDRTNIVKVAPVGTDLARGLVDYHLDFPGDALRPGCTYEQFEERLVARSRPTTYAHVVSQAGVPGRIALQYWFYYIYNDWLNKHEGDWEMIQLDFDAPTSEAALAQNPVDVGYSQHSSAERARWGDDKLELIDGTHPVVYPAMGSQANFFTSDLYLMRSPAEGVGCDDTRGPSRTIRPDVKLVPESQPDYLRRFPWLGFDGRWGEKQAAFFNGPTGPNLKTQWTEPFTWSTETWRNASFTVPAAGTTGTAATDVFCTVIAHGSEVLRQIKVHPARSAGVAAVLAILLLWAATRTRWKPSSPEGLSRQRAWGQLVAAGTRRFAERPSLFLTIGALLIPLGLAAALCQWVLDKTALQPLVREAGERNAFVAGIAIVVGIAVSLIGFAFVQAATAYAVRELDAGRQVSAGDAYRFALRRARPLVGALAISVAVRAALDLTIVLIPVAAYLLVRWSFYAIVVGADPSGSSRVLRRSAAATRGAWWRTASITVGLTAVALIVGPLLGVLLLVTTTAGFGLVNVVAAIVYTAALPLVTIIGTYLYAELTARPEPAVGDTDPPAAV
jgi:hypothetical protein